MSSQRSPRNTSPSAPLDPLEPADRFRAALATGDFNTLLGRGLRRMLRQAAADPALEFEIGVLRLTLLRLLAAEADPHRLAADIARVARVALQAAALRPQPDSGAAEFSAILQRQLDILDREVEAEAARNALPPPVSDFLPR